jgi:hypothetical protein
MRKIIVAHVKPQQTIENIAKILDVCPAGKGLE